VRLAAAFLAVSALMMLAGCARQETTGVSVNRAMGAFIPPDAKALAGAHIDKLEASDLYRRQVTNLVTNLPLPVLDQFSKTTGLDPRRDLAEVVAAWDGKRYLLILRGTFSPAVLERKLREAGVHSIPYEKYTLWGNAQNSVALLNPSLAVAGSIEMLKPAIDRFESGGGGVPEELKNRMKLIPSGDQLWLVSRGGLPFAEAQMRSDIGSMLSNIVDYVSATNLGIGLDSGLHLRAEVVCISNEGAKRVHDALRGAIGFGRLSAKSDQTDLLKAYDAIQVEQAQQTVHISADLTGTLAADLLNLLNTPGPRPHR
jgi:hypothetical protein